MRAASNSGVAGRTIAAAYSSRSCSQFPSGARASSASIAPQRRPARSRSPRAAAKLGEQRQRVHGGPAIDELPREAESLHRPLLGDLRPAELVQELGDVEERARLHPGVADLLAQHRAPRSKSSRARSGFPSPSLDPAEHARPHRPRAWGSGRRRQIARLSSSSRRARGEILRRHSADREAMEQDGDCALVPQPLELRERRSHQRRPSARSRPRSRSSRRAPEGRARAARARCPGRARASVVEPADALEGIVDDPELLHRDRQAECELEVVVERPVDRSTDVVQPLAGRAPGAPGRCSPPERLADSASGEEVLGVTPLQLGRRRRTPRGARPRTRGSSRASRSGRPCGGRGSSRRATGACRGRRRRPPRPTRACSRRRRRRAGRTAVALPATSRSCDHSIVARSVFCRSSASRPPLKRSSRSPSRSRICSGVSAFVRAAASSSASGMLSRRRQSSSTAALGSTPAREAEELDRVRIGERQHLVLDLAADAEQLARGDEQLQVRARLDERGQLEARRRRPVRGCRAASSSSRSPMWPARSPCAPSVCATAGSDAAPGRGRSRARPRRRRS